MPFVKNGSIEDFFGKPANNGLSSKFLSSWALDIASGMCYLHHNKLVHRDLFARNILIDSGPDCVLADFGLLRPVGDATGKMYYRQKGDGAVPLDLAPETVEDLKFSPASDVFRFALTLFQIATECRAAPFPWNDGSLSPAQTRERLRESVVKGYPELFSQLPASVPLFYRHLMLQCLAFEPHDRRTSAAPTSGVA